MHRLDLQRFHLARTTMPNSNIALRGQSLLANATYNKGSAFSAEEREAFGLIGMLPVQIDTIDKQMNRAYGQYNSLRDDLQKNTFLQSLKGMCQRTFVACIAESEKRKIGFYSIP
jgi:malate dehydrogenase (oxaloacetate-decarboxylating)